MKIISYKIEEWTFLETFSKSFGKVYIRGRSVTVESITFVTLSVKEILRWKKIESAHLLQTDIQK